VETNPLEPVSHRFGDLQSELCGQQPRIRHQTFSAGFIDRRAFAIGDHDAQAPPAGRDGRRKPRRTAAYYEYIRT